MTRATLVGTYLAAIVAANLSIAHWGPKAAEPHAQEVGERRACRDEQGHALSRHSDQDGRAMGCDPARWQRVEQMELA